MSGENVEQGPITNEASAWEALAEDVPYAGESQHEFNAPLDSMTDTENLNMSEKLQSDSMLNPLEEFLQPNLERDGRIGGSILEYANRESIDPENEIASCLWQANQLAQINQTGAYQQLRTLSHYYGEYAKAKTLFEDFAVAETITENDNPYIGVAKGFILECQFDSLNSSNDKDTQLKRENDVLIQYAQKYIEDEPYKPSEKSSGIPTGLWGYLLAEHHTIEQNLAQQALAADKIEISSSDFFKLQALDSKNLKQKFLKLQTKCDDKVPENTFRQYL